MRGGDAFAVGRNRRAGVVGALEGDPRGTAAGCRSAVYLRATATVGGEIQAGRISAPGRLGIDAEVVGDLGERPTAQVHHVDLGIAAARQGQRQLAAIG